MTLPSFPLPLLLLPSLVAGPLSAVAAPGEPAERVVTGTVKDEAGEPIAGALLALRLRYGFTPETNWVVTGRSQDDGSFRLVVKPEWAATGAFNHERTVWCYKSDKLIETVSAHKQIDRMGDEPIEFILKTEVDANFVIRSPGGNPLAGAFVSSFHYLAGAYSPPPEEIIEVIDARSDAGGVVRLGCCDPKKLYRVQIAADGLGDQSFIVEGREQSERTTLHLAETGSLRVRLAGGAEQKAGVWIAVDSADHSPLAAHGVGNATTDESGVASIEPLAAGEYRLFCRTPEGARSLPELPEDFEIHAGETTTLDIPLKPAVRVHGAVIAVGGEQPVSGAYVSVQYGTMRQSRQTLTDDEGGYEAWVLPGQVRASAVMLPRAFEKWVRDRSRQASVEVAEGLTEVELPGIYLLKPAKLAGRLIDEKDQPIASHRVTAHATGVYAGMAGTNEQGAFELSVAEGIELTEFYIDNQPHGDMRRATAEIVSRDPLVLRIRRSGLPINVTVSTSPTPPDKLRAPEVEQGPVDTDQPIVVFAKNAVVSGGKAGDYIDAQEYLQSFDRPNETSPTFVVTQGLVRDREAYEEVRIWTRAMRELIGFQGGGVTNLWGMQKSAIFDRLQPGDSWPPADAVKVTGRVVTAEGAPAAGAQVLLIEPPPPSARSYVHTIYLKDGGVQRENEYVLARTNGEGEFEISVTKPEQFGFIVLHPDGYAEEPGYPADGTGQPITLTPWARVVATVDQGKKRNQSLSFSYQPTGFAGVRYISLYGSSQRGEPRHDFVAAPPNATVTIQRTAWTEEGLGYMISPSSTQIKTEPGVTTHVEFGPLSDADKRDIEANFKRSQRN